MTEGECTWAYPRALEAGYSIAQQSTGLQDAALRNEHLGDLFTDRQLVALTTFSDLVAEARERVCADSVAAAMPNDGAPLRDGGAGATAYAEAVGVYLAFAVDRMANTLCTIALWSPTRGQSVTAFSRQALPMTWDFPM